MQLKIKKTDGSNEDYLHTKVIGALSNVLSSIGQPDIYVAEQLAEVVTYFLYHRQETSVIASREVLSIIKAVLTATGHQDAALELSEHYFERKLKRSRIEVVRVDVQQLCDADALTDEVESSDRHRWDKSNIVKSLIAEHNLHRQTARTIASMVEEKILSIGITLVPVSLIRQLVLSDTAAVLRAERQLQTV
jgi:hypothetical protein